VPYFTRQVAPNGLIINAYIGVSEARRDALVAAQQAVPNPIQILGLIDTGASHTCVDPSVLNQLGLTPTGTVQVATPSTGTQPVMHDQYDTSLIIFAGQGHPPLVHLTIPVTKSELLTIQGFHALIGRDILSGCLLTYDGVNGFFSLAY
jgi:hypothetical protein